MPETSITLKNEAIRLRSEKRMSLTEIAALLKVAKSSVSVWLRDYPLTEAERQARYKTASRYVAPKKNHGTESKHYRVLNGATLLPQRKGNIAEAAILFRLALHRFEVFASPFDGDKIDFVVRVPNVPRLLKVQVRWVVQANYGLPLIYLTCADGHRKRRRYQPDEFDFIVGYYLFNDTAYVYSYQEIAQNKVTVAISEDYAECWEKLRTAPAI